MTTADQIANVMLETKRYDSPTTYKCSKGERDFDYICYAHIVPISVDALTDARDARLRTGSLV
jgi:hypothetical protein